MSRAFPLTLPDARKAYAWATHDVVLATRDARVQHGVCPVPCAGRATAPAVVPDPHAADGSTSPVDQPASTHTHSTGTSGTPFRSTLEGALMGSVEVLGNMLTVSAMLEYQHKSHEELRSGVRISVTPGTCFHLRWLTCIGTNLHIPWA